MSVLTWTHDRVEILKKLWAGGLSASQIAAEIGQVSRNAVIGKVHRLGLAGRIKSTSSARPAKRKAVQRREPTVRIRAQSLKQVHEAQAEERSMEIIEEFVEPTAQSVGLLELTDVICHWPNGDPRSPEFHFCGGKAMSALPYCAHHARIAYQPASERRRSRSDEISDAERARRADLSKRMAARSHAKRMGAE